MLFSRRKEICSTPLSQCNRIGEEFNFKSVREKSDERYGFNRSCKTMPGSDGVDTPGRSIEANQSLVEEALMRLEKSVAESRTEIYLSRTKVMEMLEVASATLWRWEKCGYLVPLSVGGKKRYRLSDIQRLLNR